MKQTIEPTLPHKREVSVVNTILQVYYNEKQQLMRNMKLQKLLYFVDGVHAAEEDGQRCLIDDFKTWPYGPVLESVYYAFRQYRYSHIKSYSVWEDDKAKYEFGPHTKVHKIVTRVILKLGNMDDMDLAMMTHEKGSPWWQGNLSKRGPIDNEAIRKHFSKNTDKYAIPK